MSIMIFALSLATAASPAASNPPRVARPAADQVAQAKRTTTAPERKYCISYEGITGSRMRGGKVCRTKAQWLRQDVDIDHPAKEI
ncbi:MAG: hypothetical protein ABIW03_00905 [Sphingomicrobium sp.]